MTAVDFFTAIQPLDFRNKNIEILLQLSGKRVTTSFVLVSLFFVKGALEGLRQFLITESPLKIMKNAFYFTLKALFVLKLFKFLSRLFDHAEKTNKSSFNNLRRSRETLLSNTVIVSFA